MPRKQRFLVISPGWECEKFVDTWYRSLKRQSNINWQAVVIDDASKDATYDRVKNLKDPRITLIRNRTHAGACFSRFRALSYVEPNDIVVLLDLDDWLLDRAFAVVQQKYWDGYKATFGGYRTHTGGGAINSFYSESQINRNTFVSGNFRAPPLRTFHSSTIEYIQESDFKGPDGKWLRTCTDVAFTWPILWNLRYNEIARISQVLYVYRTRGDSSKRFSKQEGMKILRDKYHSRPHPDNKDVETPVQPPSTPRKLHPVKNIVVRRDDA